MYNNAWLEMGWSIKSHFHTRGEDFDHSSCTAELFNPTKWFLQEFKYCNFWNDDPKFREELERSWSRGYGNLEGQQLLSHKIKWLRLDLKPLKRKELANISKRASVAREVLKDIQERVDKDPLNENLRTEELQARKMCKFLNNAEHSFLTQQAKSKTLNEFNKSSKYFHSIIKSTSARNAISFIRRSDGSITGDMDAIIGDFSSFYHNLFGKATPRERLDASIFV